MKSICQLSYRIPFSETDAMGIVHHSNHARYFERGRVEFLRLVDLGYSEIVRRGFHFPLTEMQIQYKRPLNFDDVIVVESTISELTRVRMNFRYKIYRVDDQDFLSRMIETGLEGNPLVTAQTFHCCVNEKGRPVEMPEDLYEALLKLRIQ